MKAKHSFKLLLGSVIVLLGSCSTGSSIDIESEASAISTIKIGGSSETYEILELLTEAYEAKMPNNDFDYLPPGQTDGGIEGVKLDAMDIGAVSRVLTADEASEELTYLPLVKTPMLLAVHESVTGVTNISTDQLKAIYKGDITNWKELGGPDAPIALLDFPEDENEKQVFRQAYLGDDFKITPDAIVLPEDDEVIETLGSTDFSLAVVPLEDEIAELPVRVLSIDGVAPSSENLQSGVYKMTLQLGMVFATEPSPEVQSFVEFVSSPEGQEILTATNFIVTSDD